MRTLIIHKNCPGRGRSGHLGRSFGREGGCARAIVCVCVCVCVWVRMGECTRPGDNLAQGEYTQTHTSLSLTRPSLPTNKFIFPTNV